MKVILYLIGFFVYTNASANIRMPIIKSKALRNNIQHRQKIVSHSRKYNPITQQEDSDPDIEPKTKKSFSINNRKFHRSLRKGVAFGIGASSTVPLMNDIADFTDKYEILQSKLDSALIHSYINPKEYTLQYECKGDEWSYSKLMHSLNEKTIEGLSIHQDGTYAVVIDTLHNTQEREINPYDLHHVTTIPLHITELIQRLILNDINFDIIQ